MRVSARRLGAGPKHVDLGRRAPCAGWRPDYGRYPLSIRSHSSRADVHLPRIIQCVVDGLDFVSQVLKIALVPAEHRRPSRPKCRIGPCTCEEVGDG